MSDSAHELSVLVRGAAVWNAWRSTAVNPILTFPGADLHLVNLDGADLSGVNLEYANLAAYLSRANLRSARLRHASFQNALLINAALEGADATGAHFAGTKMQGICCHEAKMRTCYFNADLTDACFEKADLSFACFSFCKLRNANFSGARLSGSVFVDCDVAGTIFAESIFRYTTLAKINMLEASGLESIIHGGPSWVDLQTLSLTLGALPRDFVLGIGVPQKLEATIRDNSQNVAYVSCFISHSHAYLPVHETGGGSVDGHAPAA
jgi:uncharacterized protein YjbI with pentapeptide repeats